MGLNDKIITQYITDFAEIINMNNEEITLLENDFRLHYENGGDQIVTIIIPSLNGKSIKKIGMEFCETNGFGDAEKNNGVLLIMSEKEKKIRIILGSGIEDKYPISYLRKIVEGKLRPLMNKGNYTELFKYWKKYTIHNNIREQNALKMKITFLLIIGFLFIIGLIFFGMFLGILREIYLFDNILFLSLLFIIVLFILSLWRLFKNNATDHKKVIAATIFSLTFLGILFGRMGYLLIKYPQKFQNTGIHSSSNNNSEYKSNSDNRDYDYGDSYSIGGGGSTSGAGYGD